jgi:hypothetical protein
MEVIAKPLKSTIKGVMGQIFLITKKILLIHLVLVRVVDLVTQELTIIKTSN